MTVASGWFASGTFWAGAGTVVTLAGIIVGAWAAFAAAFPRRRLWYGLRSAVQVPSHAEARSSSELELLFRRDPPLADPYIATVELTARSRVDIPSGAFDGGAPLLLGLGARIVEVLPVTSRPETVPKPKIVASAHSLQFGPSLIGKRQQVTVNLPTEGKPSLSLRENPLANVKVRERSYEVNPFLLSRLTLIIVSLVAGVSLAIGAAFTVSGVLSSPPNPGHETHLLPYVKTVTPSVSSGTRSPSAP